MGQPCPWFVSLDHGSWTSINKQLIYEVNMTKWPFILHYYNICILYVLSHRIIHYQLFLLNCRPFLSPSPPHPPAPPLHLIATLPTRIRLSLGLRSSITPTSSAACSFVVLLSLHRAHINHKLIMLCRKMDKREMAFFLLHWGNKSLRGKRVYTHKHTHSDTLLVFNYAMWSVCPLGSGYPYVLEAPAQDFISGKQANKRIYIIPQSPLELPTSPQSSHSATANKAALALRH